MPTMGNLHPWPFAAWVLATLLVVPPAQAADSIDLRAVAGLPRAGIIDGQAVAWRNVGVVAESDWLAAEVKFASCLPGTAESMTPSNRSGSACAGSAGALAVIAGHILTSGIAPQADEGTAAQIVYQTKK